MYHQLIITLGSNSNGRDQLSVAMNKIDKWLHLLAYTPMIETEPIDFPYPSGLFVNSVLWCETDWSIKQVERLLIQCEEDAGRTNSLRFEHPECIPLDADLIAWDEHILRPKDLARPYLRDGLVALGLSLPFDI